MKITQIRENGDTEALSVVNIDLLIEKMKRETKLRPVSELRQALHFVLNRSGAINQVRIIAKT